MDRLTKASDMYFCGNVLIRENVCALKTALYLVVAC